MPIENSDLQLREATDKDKKFIYQLIETTMRSYVEQIWGSFSEERTLKHTADAIQKKTYSIVQYQSQDIGAFAIERHQTHIQLEQIYIHPSHQNKGIGTHLIRALIQEAKETSKPIRLRVLSGNPAKKLYEREGFCTTSITPERAFMELRV